ncbi:MAG: sulfotransferase [Cyanobacteriota bacterium]|nr:sulfotransferase [Cyanobacteriota bacterium]
MPKVPDSIVIGAGKCGTTSLHDYLAQHPQLYICPQKETYFFLEASQRNKFRAYGAITDPDEYYALFKDAPAGSQRLEISTNYYAYAKSAKLIKAALPDVKIIAILRDPANRAFSSYQMLVRGGHEKEDFENIIVENNKYVKRGFYYRQLLPYFEVFDRARIKILFFEDLCSQPVQFVQDLFAYLEVDPQFTPDMQKRGREGGLPKNAIFHSLLTQKNPIRQAAATVLKPFLPEQRRQQMRKKMVKKNIAKVKLSPESRQKLIEIYRSDILQLQDWVGRDLSAWLK